MKYIVNEKRYVTQITKIKKYKHISMISDRSMVELTDLLFDLN